MNDGEREGRRERRKGDREAGREERWSVLSITLGETLSNACCMDYCSSILDS